MLLGEIRNYLQQRGNASLTDIATHFDIAEETARFALHYWQQKGKAREMLTACGGGCSGKSCGSSGTATQYEWVRREIPLNFFPPLRKRSA